MISLKSKRKTICVENNSKQQVQYSLTAYVIWPVKKQQIKKHIYIQHVEIQIKIKRFYISIWN